MLKWLKNDEEFYRTVPKAVLRPNQRRTFHIDGVKVDIENSKVMSKTISRSFCNVVNKSSDLYYNCYNQIQDTHGTLHYQSLSCPFKQDSTFEYYSPRELFIRV